MESSHLKFSVGLEIHGRLKTRQKIFCSCRNHYGDEPNTNTCPVCLGLPGTLPVFNGEIVEPALKAAQALNCRIQENSQFSRKNYFYSDLPRNYQITQYHFPLALGGHLDVSDFRVNLQRIHLEEDAGRSLSSGNDLSSIDLNRAGTPLMEIVTEPDLENGQQARMWLGRLRQLLRYLDVCDGNMETGSLRCDANVGLLGPSKLSGPWIELKNLNSFKAVEKAVNFEIGRMRDKLAAGESLRRETRAWNPRLKQTTLLRLKEDAADYRYYPEPDLPNLFVSHSMIQDIQSRLPELPWQRESRFSTEFGVSNADAVTLCRSLALGSYFETCVLCLWRTWQVEPTDGARVASRWILSHVLEAVGGKDALLYSLKLKPDILAEILALLTSGTIHKTRARLLFQQALDNTENVSVAKLLGEPKLNDSLLDDLCHEILTQNPLQVAAFREGKVGLLNFFVGLVMSQSGGRLEAEEVRKNLLKSLI